MRIFYAFINDKQQKEFVFIEIDNCICCRNLKIYTFYVRVVVDHLRVCASPLLNYRDNLLSEVKFRVDASSSNPYHLVTAVKWEKWEKYKKINIPESKTPEHLWMKRHWMNVKRGHPTWDRHRHKLPANSLNRIIFPIVFLCCRKLKAIDVLSSAKTYRWEPFVC